MQKSPKGTGLQIGRRIKHLSIVVFCSAFVGCGVTAIGNLISGSVTVDGTAVEGAIVVFSNDDGRWQDVTDDGGEYLLSDLPRALLEGTAQAPGALCPRVLLELEVANHTHNFVCESLADLWELAYEPRSNTCAVPTGPFTAEYTVTTSSEGGETFVEMEHESAPTLSGFYDHEALELRAQTALTDIGDDAEFQEDILLQLVAQTLVGSSTLHIRSKTGSDSCEIVSDVVMSRVN